MEYFPPALEKMVEQFARLPGIGRKTAQRLAFFVLSLPENEVEIFAQSVLDAKRSIALCPVCQNLTEGDGLCPICASEKRDSSLVCVVADPKDVIAMERAREYQGKYHVLHGVLSPMNGVGPDDLHIKSLLDRVAQGEVQEIIMATNPDTEGEATAMYLSRMLKPFGVKVTRLAYGVPVGGHLEYADDATLMLCPGGPAGDVIPIKQQRSPWRDVHIAQGLFLLVREGVTAGSKDGGAPRVYLPRQPRRRFSWPPLPHSPK